MAKPITLPDDLMDSAPAIPQAAQVKEPTQTGARPTGRRGSPKVGQVPLQLRWPRAEVKAAKMAAMQDDFPTVSDFMLACLHAYLKSRDRA